MRKITVLVMALIVGSKVFSFEFTPFEKRILDATPQKMFDIMTKEKIDFKDLLTKFQQRTNDSDILIEEIVSGYFKGKIPSDEEFELLVIEEYQGLVEVDQSKGLQKQYFT
ncbi:MAG: hypothetical protein LBU17_05780, partial [Treponema sp.]|nr:hypothetical protein [Treponema sp.]